MRTLLLALVLSASMLVLSGVSAQPGSPAKDDPNGIVARFLAFDKNNDGKLTREELTDVRLQRLFDLADKKKAGFVTREDLVAFAASLTGQEPATKDGKGGRDGKEEKDGKGSKGPRDGGFPKDGFPKDGFGKGGPGGGPGQVLPVFLQERLGLTADQKKQVETLQTEVDAKLNKILTEEQRGKLKEIRERGPFGKGGPKQ